MIILFSKKFKKEYVKLSQTKQEQIIKRINLFLKNKKHPQLNNHPLHGKESGYFSINVSGDMRIIYEQLNAETVLFIKIGTHSQLY